MQESVQKVTSEILWQAAFIFLLIDIPFVTILVRRINREMFHQVQSTLVAVTTLFWFFIWILMCVFFWQPVYHYVFPEWARWLIPPVYALLFAAVALCFWWLSLRLPGQPTLSFCVLGGLWGAATHLWGVSRGLVDKVPLLQGVSLRSVAVMPVFEFMFYWCVILTVTFLLHKRWNRPGHSMHKPGQI